MKTGACLKCGRTFYYYNDQHECVYCDGYKQGQLSQQKSELRFLKSINNGASYCWMCNKIDKRIKQIQGGKTE